MTPDTWMCAILGTIILAPLLALVLPLGIYIVTTWQQRRQEILGSMTDDAVKRYFQTFYAADLRAGRVGASSQDQLREFGRRYSVSFGRWKFILPAALLVSLITVLSVFTAHGVKPHLAPFLGLPASPSCSSFAFVGFAGFAGGYMWVLLYIARRLQERLLTPFDLYTGCTRIVLCIPVAFALTALFRGAVEEHALAAVAFMLGAFPMNTLLTFMRRTAASKLKLQESFDDQATNLTLLQGIGRDEAETYSKEGVSTVLQLAYSDPVDITIRTGYPFSYVVDCCSQALAWLYFADDLPKLRRFSLRGAQEICTLVLELSRQTHQDDAVMDEEQAWAEMTMYAVAKELNMEKVVLRRTFDEIAFDPYVQFLYDVWQPAWN
jgi:hypothetical protein